MSVRPVEAQDRIVAWEALDSAALSLELFGAICMVVNCS
jgi:hypothetical protein